MDGSAPSPDDGGSLASAADAGDASSATDSDAGPEAGVDAAGGDVDAGIDDPVEDDAGADTSRAYENCSPGGSECGSLECREISTGVGRWCAPSCSMAADCPSASEGMAVPGCDGFDNINTCRLDCTGASCPTGMTCEQTLVGGGMGGGMSGMGTDYFTCIWLD